MRGTTWDSSSAAIEITVSSGELKKNNEIESEPRRASSFAIRTASNEVGLMDKKYTSDEFREGENEEGNNERFRFRGQTTQVALFLPIRTIRAYRKETIAFN